MGRGVLHSLFFNKKSHQGTRYLLAALFIKKNRTYSALVPSQAKILYMHNNIIYTILNINVLEFCQVEKIFSEKLL